MGWGTGQATEAAGTRAQSLVEQSALLFSRPQAPDSQVTEGEGVREKGKPGLCWEISAGSEQFLLIQGSPDTGLFGWCLYWLTEEGQRIRQAWGAALCGLNPTHKGTGETARCQRKAVATLYPCPARRLRDLPTPRTHPQPAQSVS